MPDIDNKIPKHVAIIMDGNGRWAKKKGLPRLKGHEEGVQSVRAIVQACKNIGVKYLTLYSFSVENWSRPKSEINGLMKLLVRFLRNYEKEFHDNKIRLRVIGKIEEFEKNIQKELLRVIDSTQNYEDKHLILALNYGGRDEIVMATRKIAEKIRLGKMNPDDINEKTIADYLYAPDIPDPDLLIRTSGEMRISNFLLWQISYTELYITKTLWPDFKESEFIEALKNYAGRNRRFGGIK